MAEEAANVLRIPVFVEVEQTKKDPALGLCRKALSLLGTGSLAVSCAEVRQVLQALQEQGATPPIFVVNTFNAKPLLAELDNLIGEAPVLFLRRKLYAGQSGLQGFLQTSGSGALNTGVMISGMKTRLTSIWYYGTQTTDKVATHAARALRKFLTDGDFRHIEFEQQLCERAGV